MREPLAKVMEPAGAAVLVGQAAEELEAEVFELLAARLADLAEQQALEAGAALAVVGADLGEQGVGLARAARPAVGDSGRPARLVGSAAGGVKAELFGLGHVVDPRKFSTWSGGQPAARAASR